MINNPLIRLLAQVVSCASLSDNTSYRSSLRKFHVFCDVFRVPEEDLLPASFEVLHYFAVWAASALTSLAVTCGSSGGLNQFRFSSAWLQFVLDTCCKGGHLPWRAATTSGSSSPFVGLQNFPPENPEPMAAKFKNLLVYSSE